MEGSLTAPLYDIVCIMTTNFTVVILFALATTILLALMSQNSRDQSVTRSSCAWKMVEERAMGNIVLSEEQPDELTCSVCLEQFKEPKLLPCGHTFCKSCLEAVGRVDCGFYEKLPCPQCRALHELSGRGIEGFLTDYVVLRQIEFRTVKELASKNAPCGLCSESKQPLAAFCGECDTILCDYCTEAHKRMKPFRDHETVPLEELSLQAFKPKSKAHYCADHPEKTVQVYCETCKRLFCNICITENDIGRTRASPLMGGRFEFTCSHSFSSLSDAIESADTKVVELTKQIQGKLERSKNQLESIQKIEKSMEGYPDALKADINASIDSCIEMLQARRLQLLQEVDEKCTERKQNVLAQKEKVETTLATLTSTLRFTERLESSDSVERLAMNAHAIGLMEKHELVRLWDYQTIPPPPIFQSCEEEVKCTKLREFSGKDMVVKVVSQPTFPQGLGLLGLQSPLFGLQSQESSTPLGKQAQLEIIIPKCAAVHEPRFRIEYGSQVQRSIRPKTTKKADNTWTIDFTPFCGGTHKVTAYIQGVWIKKELPTFVVIGKPSVGAEVRRGPDWKVLQTKPLLDDTSKELTGKVKSVSSYCSNSGATHYDVVTVSWNSDSETEITKTCTYHWGGTGDYAIELDI